MKCYILVHFGWHTCVLSFPNISTKAKLWYRHLCNSICIADLYIYKDPLYNFKIFFLDFPLVSKMYGKYRSSARSCLLTISLYERNDCLSLLYCPYILHTFPALFRRFFQHVFTRALAVHSTVVSFDSRGKNVPQSKLKKSRFMDKIAKSGHSLQYVCISNAVLKILFYLRNFVNQIAHMHLELQKCLYIADMRVLNFRAENVFLLFS